MKTPEEIFDKNTKYKPLSYSIVIQSMKEYALEVAKETQRRCAENAMLHIDDNHIEVDKSSIMDPENLAI